MITTPDTSRPSLTASLSRVARGNLCSGCGGCTAVAPKRIVMETVAPGYLRPRQTGPVSVAEDRLIAQICPGLGQVVTAGTRTDDVLWGPYLEMRTGYATEPELRHAASSGGVLSAVLVHLLESGAVDAVIQTAAAPFLPIGNVTVLSEDAAAVQAAAGSRYAPSAPLDGITAHLDSDRRFAFVGKPCDVAALRALSEADPRVNARIPVMLSFFCGGIPSNTGGEAVLVALGTDLAGTTAFRYRGNGWPGEATATLTDGSTRAMSYHASWGGILSHHVQHRCKICADGTGDAADLVCADAWVCDDRGYPLFEERDGVSLIVARTALGQRMIEGAEASGRLTTQGFDAANLDRIQPGQTKRRRALLARLVALRLLGRQIPNYRGLHLRAAARQNSLLLNVKNFLGTIRRGIFGRIG